METTPNPTEQQLSWQAARQRRERLNAVMDAMWANNIVPQMIAEQQQAEAQTITT